MLKNIIKNNKDKDTKIKKKFRFDRIFYNNRFVLVFSIVFAFIVWIAVASSDSENVPVTISNIPVSITLSDSAVKDGLQVFSGQDIKASVSITGNRIIVGQVTNSDIQVLAPQASSIIDSPGNYTLELVAKKTGILTNYDIVSTVSPSFITVTVDRYREVDFDVQDGIKYKANSDYFVSTTVFSTATVKVSGPETEISKVKRVVAEGEISEELKESKTIKSKLSLYDAYGEKISSDKITLSATEVDATIPVLERKELPIEVVYTNKPSGLTISSSRVSVKPSKLEIAASSETFKSLNKIKLIPLDFSDINIHNNSFDLQVDLPTTCKNLSNTYSARVTVNMGDMKQADFKVSQFSFKSLSDDKVAKSYTSSIIVKVVGPTSQINNLKSSEIAAEADFSDKSYFTGRKEMPVTIKIKNKLSCWAYGDYSADIGVSPKP